MIFADVPTAAKVIITICTSPLQKLYSWCNAQGNQHAMLRLWVAWIHACLIPVCKTPPTFTLLSLVLAQFSFPVEFQQPREMGPHHSQKKQSYEVTFHACKHLTDFTNSASSKACLLRIYSSLPNAALQEDTSPSSLFSSSYNLTLSYATELCKHAALQALSTISSLLGH